MAETLLERAGCCEGVPFITGPESREKDRRQQDSTEHTPRQHENTGVTSSGGDKRQHTGLAGPGTSAAARPVGWEAEMRRVCLSVSRPDLSRYQKL